MTVLNKYMDFINILSSDLVTQIPKYIKINNYVIK